MPFVIYNVMGLDKLKPICSRFFMVDLSIKEPVGIGHNVEVMVALFTYTVD